MASRGPAAADHDQAGLSRRELEVMRLVAHVRHILAKLRCRSRAEAAARAGELGLLPRP